MKDIKNRSIYKTLTDRLGVCIISASVLLTAFAILAVPVLAQHADKAATPNCASPENKASENDAGDTDLSRADIRRIADNWADAVKNGDGKAQYALMSKSLKASVFDEFEELNWVTGTSSPWIQSYRIQTVGESARVTFRYRASTGPTGAYTQELKFIKEDKEVKINSISAPVKVGDSAAA